MLVSGEVINVIKGFICHIDDSDKGGSVNKAQREGGEGTKNNVTMW